MSLSGVSSSLAYGLTSYVTKTASHIQTDLNTQTAELSTGKIANKAQSLGASLGEAAQLRQNLEAVQAHASANAQISNFLESSQTALSFVQSTAEGAQKQILAAITSNNASAVRTIAADALQSVLSTLNGAHNGQFLFAGENSGQAPMTPFSSTPPSASQNALSQAFQSTFGAPPDSASNAAITPQAMQSFLNGPFASQFSSANWSANWSQASDKPLTVEIAPGKTEAYSISANDPAIKNIIQGLTMAAGLGLTTLSSGTQNVIYQQASQVLSTGVGQLSDVRGNLGIVQSDATFATDSLNAQASYLQSSIGGFEDADANQLAATIANLTTQLEATYSLTHLMSQLSLTNYISN